MPAAECPFKLTRGCWIGYAESKKIRENILSDKLLVFLFSLGAISHDLITKAFFSYFSLPERSSQNYCSSLDCFSKAPKLSRGLSPHFPRQNWVCGASSTLSQANSSPTFSTHPNFLQKLPSRRTILTSETFFSSRGMNFNQNMTAWKICINMNT